VLCGGSVILDPEDKKEKKVKVMMASYQTNLRHIIQMRSTKQQLQP
jgi:hypothetical protein